MNHQSDNFRPLEGLSMRTSYTQLAGKIGHGRKKLGGRYEHGIGPYVIYMGFNN